MPTRFRSVLPCGYLPYSPILLAAWLCTLITCPSTRLLQAEDWLQFRGTIGDGESRVVDLPTSWSATEHIKWRCELPGEGWSSPTVLGNRIYVSAAIPTSEPAAADSKAPASSERELALLMIDATSGKLVQRVKLFTQPAATPKIHSKNSHASPTPIIAGDRIYVHFGHLGTACTTLDGKIIWSNDKLSYAPVHGNGGSPALVGKSLIFSQDGSEKGKVIALNADTGDVMWEVPREVEATKKFSFCTPLVLESNGQAQVILPGSNVVQSLDAATGKEIWRVRYEGYSVIPRPIVAGGLIMICTGYDRPTLIAIRPGGQGDVTDTHVAWQTKTGVPHTPSLNTRDGLLFMVSDSGIASCLEAATGKELWKERIGGNFSASPLLAGDNLYLLSEEGDTTIVKADRTFKQVARNRLEDRTLASMAVIDRDLLIRSKSGLWRVTK
ncbi:MAG: PQQ-binding-like beta-propeller repeat protein [Pirellulaceae bacterium]|nr:PQQ-binding-like beta-propeller repeat protein [Pirellulaceae bacterium]